MLGTVLGAGDTAEKTDIALPYGAPILVKIVNKQANKYIVEC